MEGGPAPGALIIYHLRSKCIRYESLNLVL